MQVNSNKEILIMLYEDNTLCIFKFKRWFIKSDRTKHISPKFLLTHEVWKNGDIDIQQIQWSDYLADLSTNSLFQYLRNLCKRSECGVSKIIDWEPNNTSTLFSLVTILSHWIFQIELSILFLCVNYLFSVLFL